MKNIICKVTGLAIIVLLTIISSPALAQSEKGSVVTDQVQLNKLKKAVEANPDSLSGHRAYIKAMGLSNAALEKQYDAWMKQYPKSAMISYALGKAYTDEESPKAKPYLLKAVSINPKLTEAWGALWIDAERWGDFELARTYLGKAVESNPNDPNYNFYYASSFKVKDNKRYEELSLAVAKKFPNHERGAQALYWLATRSHATADKIKYYELLKDSYDPLKFNWSSSGMSGYYNLLLSLDATKAVDIAEMMAKEEKNKKEWGNLSQQAKYIVEANQLMAQKKTIEAASLLDKVKLPRYFSFNQEVVILKAKNDDIAGRTSAAYDSIIVSFARKPSKQFKEIALSYGQKLARNSEQVTKDIWQRLDSQSKIATPFALKQYLETGNRSLADYKGKVVLLTYWFPGCGPCRGEFPHFENVVRKFKKEDLAYVGINIVSDQNDYVVPFMKSSGYSFTPLEDVKGRIKGNLDNGNAAPVNFLIDQQGRLMFANFRTDGDNEDELELMISMLKDRK